jgi:hypothetical protein
MTMSFEYFVDSLKDAGWVDIHDAQWEGARKLYDELFAHESVAPGSSKELRSVLRPEADIWVDGHRRCVRVVHEKHYDAALTEIERLLRIAESKAILPSEPPATSSKELVTPERLGILKQSPRSADVTDVEDLCEEVERLRDYGWWTQVARRALGFATDRELASLRTTHEPGAWQPIETAPKDREVLFWVEPLSTEETYRDTSGNPITSGTEPRMMLCRFGRWSSLSKATRWADVPDSPALTKGASHE